HRSSIFQRAPVLVKRSYPTHPSDSDRTRYTGRRLVGGRWPRPSSPSAPDPTSRCAGNAGHRLRRIAVTPGIEPRALRRKSEPINGLAAEIAELGEPKHVIQKARGVNRGWRSGSTVKKTGVVPKKGRWHGQLRQGASPTDLAILARRRTQSPC